MFEILNLNNSPPYLKYIEFYENAIKCDQKNIDAILIASYNKNLMEVNARYVNLKFIDNNKWIFFSNYNSPKADEFFLHDQITAVTYWPACNSQIRMKAIIKKTTSSFSKKYFTKRSKEKNALSISSYQSKQTASFEQVKNNYNNVLLNENLENCPDYWGGYVFTPYYFEFWEGHESRLNKRESFELNGDDWVQSFLQP